jgi:hypothetical protein
MLVADLPRIRQNLPLVRLESGRAARRPAAADNRRCARAGLAQLLPASGAGAGETVPIDRPPRNHWIVPFLKIHLGPAYRLRGVCARAGNHPRKLLRQSIGAIRRVDQGAHVRTMSRICASVCANRMRADRPGAFVRPYRQPYGTHFCANPASASGFIPSSLKSLQRKKGAGMVAR